MPRSMAPAVRIGSRTSSCSSSASCASLCFAFSASRERAEQGECEGQDDGAERGAETETPTQPLNTPSHALTRPHTENALDPFPPSNPAPSTRSLSHAVTRAPRWQWPGLPPTQPPPHPAPASINVSAASINDSTAPILVNLNPSMAVSRPFLAG
eukprot:3638234-Rhodomonas_salina.1